ncbi:MAG TPA: hypothetical protein VFC10_07460 [Terriglobia bacterium]|jgi:hypothetical protein|nr:hypothetical protein [Terracidiphilus sp.]HZT69571.1 hypothetical protein [Terriglobia bacterium]
MSDRKTNGHSKLEDFLLPEFPETEEATLPSGLRVRLRPPVGLEFWARVGDLPGSLAAAARGEKAEKPSADELIAWSYQLICALIAEPKFSREPKEGEFHPRRLRPEDRAWLVQYYNRYTAGGGGAALESFRDAAGEPAGARPGGEAVREGAE